MDKERILERLKKDLRSLLIASKEGLTIQELEHDYRMLIGSPPPVKSLDYRSTMEMVCDMPDVVTVKSKADGTIILIGVVNEDTKGVAELVSRQKTSRRSISRRRVTKPRYHGDLVRRGRIAPVLPASLKSDLRDLLSISPLLVSQLETAFYNRFGRSFQYTRYGFYSLLEVLRSVSDMVQVTQTRAGSLLMLKTPYNHGTFTGFIPKPVTNWSYNKVTSAKSAYPCRVLKDEAPYSRNKTSINVSLPLASSASLPFTGCMPAPSATAPFIGPTSAPSGTSPSTGPTSALSATALSTGPTPAPSATALSTGPRPAPSKNAQSTASRLFPLATVPSSGLTPASSATTSSSGLTVLDKLFKAAEAEFYASKYSLKNDTKANLNCETGDSTVHFNSVEITKTPLSSLPPAIIQDTNNNLLVQPPPNVETVTAEVINLAGDLKVDIVESSMDCNLQELEEALDRNLKLCLSQKTAGSVISPELQQEIKTIVHKYPGGLSISKLPVLYKEYTGKILPFRDLGFMSVLDLVGSLGDTLHLESTKNGDWCLFDAEKKCKENETGKVSLLVNEISGWNSAAETSELIKPLVIKIPPAAGIGMWIQEFKLSDKEQEIPPDAVRKQKLHCLPYMKRGFIIGVFVENVTSPNEFYIRCYSKDTSQKLEDMMIEMRSCYSNENISDRYVVPDDCVIVGEIYAVRVAGDVWWYRVIVHSVISSEDVQVYYPDFGNVGTVKRQWLRFLKACYMRLPAQAVPSSLAFVKPVEDRWSNEVMKIFQQYCTHGPLVGIVLQYVLGRLHLYLCDTSTDEDVYLHQLLLHRGLASVVQDLEYYQDFQKRNMFDNYLIQSSEQPQEESQEPTLPSEEDTTGLKKEAIIQVTEETELEMPFLEAIPSGEDVWDESWSLSGSTVPINDILKPSINNTDDLQSQNPSQKTVNRCANSADTDCFSHHPPEEFYISLIKTRNSVEKASVSLPAKCGLNDNSEISSPTNGYIPPITPEEEKTENKNVMVFQGPLSDDKETKGNSPLIGFQKLQIPRRSTTVALGPAARLAASPRNLLHWLSTSTKT
ncbi:tudor domain-containing protein 5 [Lithobates pipiens]